METKRHDSSPKAMNSHPFGVRIRTLRVGNQTTCFIDPGGRAPRGDLLPDCSGEPQRRRETYRASGTAITYTSTTIGSWRSTRPAALASALSSFNTSDTGTCQHATLMVSQTGLSHRMQTCS